MPAGHNQFLLKRCRLLQDHPEAKRWNKLRDAKGEPIMIPRPYFVNQVVRCVMVSRFGDLGITDDLKATHGYDLRVEAHEIEILGD